MKPEILDALAARAGFRLTPTVAHKRFVCVRCERPVMGSWTRADLAEWALSALCPKCWAEIFPEEPDCE